MTWTVFKKEILSLSQKIDFKPDILVGIVRGGLVPTRVLSNILNVKNVYCLSVNKIAQQRKVQTEIKVNLKNKKILLIEDILETGKSLIEAKKYLELQGANIKTASLYIMPRSEIKPDFYLKTIYNLVKFPWE